MCLLFVYVLLSVVKWFIYNCHKYIIYMLDDIKNENINYNNFWFYSKQKTYLLFIPEEIPEYLNVILMQKKFLWNFFF